MLAHMHTHMHTEQEQEMEQVSERSRAGRKGKVRKRERMNCVALECCV